jgi:hypothetical protein
MPHSQDRNTTVDVTGYQSIGVKYAGFVTAAVTQA